MINMEEKPKLDKLGRRIPSFDRKAAAAKAQITRELRNGTDYNSRIGTMGGHIRTRGYLGYLKDTDPQKLRELTSQAGKASGKTRKEKANKIPDSKAKD